jgi:hypothetical protein
MRRQDRELLARIARVNDTSGQVMLAILGDQDRCDPDAVRLRALGKTYGELGADLLARAAELDGRTVQGTQRVIIDARS